jgi:hypothetical protein
LYDNMDFDTNADAVQPIEEAGLLNDYAESDKV